MAAEKKQTNKDEQVGFHKGSLSTLAKEREELLKMNNIVEQLMQMHIKALKDLGVDLVEQAKKLKETKGKSDGRQLDEII
jgi:hypothetical protein